MRALLILAPIVLAVYALVDCIQNDRPRGLPKPAWIVVILLIPVLGPLAWLLGGHDRGWHLPTPPAPRQLAPDDDPEFLRKLRNPPAPPPAKPVKPDEDDPGSHR
jgi:hypothetical protein